MLSALVKAPHCALRPRGHPAFHWRNTSHTITVMDEKQELLVSTISRSDLDSESSSLMSPTEHDSLFDKEANLVDCDEEGQSLPEPAKRPSRLITWIVVNVCATILIVCQPLRTTTQAFMLILYRSSSTSASSATPTLHTRKSHSHPTTSS